MAARDAELLLRFVADAEDLVGDEPFAPQLLAELGRLVEADRVVYSEQDRVRERLLLDVRRADDPPALRESTYWDIAEEHPVCARHDSGDARAVKLSDFLTVTELRRSRIYAVWFRPADLEHELAVAIPSPPWHTKTLLFDRGRGRDFTERDRAVLNLLQPHLWRLWRGAHTRRQLRAATAGLEWSSEREARGAIVLAPDGRIELASPPARRLLREFFGVRTDAELPPALTEWLESGSQTLARRVADRRLTIDRSGDALLLAETRDELGLTPREREILAWVARGKTNSEIAETLWIAPTTVRKHLENIFAKLGVHTRTAAAARFLGVLDDEERQGRTPGSA
jgi:DNA-binding CsgD family transcriptional regulator